MEKYVLKKDLKVFGKKIDIFPGGIGEAFDSLVNMLPGGFDRSYYGISYMANENKMVYIAAAEEKQEGEAEKYRCERFTIAKGNYLAVTLRDWRKKTDSIKDIFQDMILDPRAEKNKPCVEWYKNNSEMVCMIRMRQMN